MILKIYWHSVFVVSFVLLALISGLFISSESYLQVFASGGTSSILSMILAEQFKLKP